MGTLRNSFFKKYFDVFTILFLVFCYLNPISNNHTYNVSIIIIDVLLCLYIICIIIKHSQYVLYLLVFLIPSSLPIDIFGESKISFPSEFVCVLLLFYLIIKSIYKSKISKSFLHHPITITLMIMVVWHIITSSTSSMPIVAFKRTVITICYMLVYFYLFYELFKNDTKRIFTIFICHALGLVYPIIKTLIFHSKYDFNSQGGSIACFPYYNDHTMYGAALAMLIPFLCFITFNYSKHKNKLLLFISSVLLPLFFIALFLSYSRAAWLSLMISFCLYIIIVLKIKMKYVIATLVTSMFIITLFWSSIFNFLEKSKEISHKNDVGMHLKSVANIKTDISNKERVNRWKCAWRMFKNKPIVGFGPGCYQFFYGPYQQRGDMTPISTFDGKKGHAHSEYLNYLSETGFIGVIIFIALITLTCYYGIKTINNTKDKNTKSVAIFLSLGFFTYVVHAFFNGFLETDKIAMPFYACIAAIVAIDIKEKSRSLHVE